MGVDGPRQAMSMNHGWLPCTELERRKWPFIPQGMRSFEQGLIACLMHDWFPVKKGGIELKHRGPVLAAVLAYYIYKEFAY